MAVRPSPSGPRGVFVLPPADLASLGRNAVGRGFTSDERARIFSERGCPDATEPIRRDLEIAGGIQQYQGIGSEEAALAGTRVVLTGVWFDLEGEVAAEALRAVGTSLGIEIVYRNANPASDRNGGRSR